MTLGGAAGVIGVFTARVRILAGAFSVLTARPDAPIAIRARIGRKTRDEKKMYAWSELGVVK